MASYKDLFIYGFLNEQGKARFGHMSIDERKKASKGLSNVSDFTDHEMRELATMCWSSNEEPHFTGYPDVHKANRLVWEHYALSLESAYFWVLNQMTADHGFHKDEVIKITDIFTASEMSTYWGVSAQRLGLQQDRASQYLRGISDMVKSMFQLIRDLNIVDEKLRYYKDTNHKNSKIATDAEIVLKGQYADLVEGGPKSPSSVFGMAQNYNFVMLPTLFFNTRIEGKDLEEIKGAVGDKIEAMEMGNKTFKNVLIRKLIQYYTWKERTHKQLKTYRKLYKSYLKQHHNNIKLYMNWVKPYLKNVKRLSSSDSQQKSADLIGAFESTMIEIEFIAAKKWGEYYSVILNNFEYRSIPQYDYVPGANDRRSLMVGRIELNIKGFVWTEKQLENYQKMKDAEDLGLISEIDSSISEAMDSMSEDITKYLEEDEDQDEPESRKWELKNGKVHYVNDGTTGPNAKRESLLAPFTAIFIGNGSNVSKSGSKPSEKKSKNDGSKKKAEGHADLTTWLLYKFFKKAHRLLSW